MDYTRILLEMNRNHTMTKISSLFVAVKQCGLLLGQNRILGQQKFLGQHSSLGLHKFLGQHSSQNLHCLPGLSKVLGFGLAMGVVLTGCGSKKKEESKPVAKAQEVAIEIAITTAYGET